jgi:hypothetical protein
MQLRGPAGPIRITDIPANPTVDALPNRFFEPGALSNDGQPNNITNSIGETEFATDAGSFHCVQHHPAK